MTVPAPITLLNPDGLALLRQHADNRQCVQFNTAAALQAAAFREGFVPNSPEFELAIEGGATYVAQRTEHPGTGEVRVYFVPKDTPIPDQVRWLDSKGEVGPTPPSEVPATPSLDGRILWEIVNFSQLAKDALLGVGDCGPTSLKTTLNFYGVQVTVDRIGKHLGLQKGYTSVGVQAMVNAAAAFGLVMEARQAPASIDPLLTEINAGRPFIWLANYQYLPYRYDEDWQGNHWLTGVGWRRRNGKMEIIYHDPYWPDALDGAFAWIDADTFLTAWRMVTAFPGSAVPYRWLKVVRPPRR